MDKELIKKLISIAQSYPENLKSGQLCDCDRIAFNINLAKVACFGDLNNKSIMDIGGGIGLFSLGCIAAGFYRVVLVDDFNDPINKGLGESILNKHQSMNVEIFARDVVKSGINDISGEFDVITSFDSMEHWHNSPKKLFREVYKKLRPGGKFILGVPNCVNIRKRLTMPFGFFRWSPIETWYDEEIFRGHVREPDVSDLHYIADDMGLIDCQIVGANWLGTKSSKWFIRWLAKIMDPILRLYPRFCSDIYLIGEKPV